MSRTYQYPITPEWLDQAPRRLVQLYSALESYLIQAIMTRLGNGLNASTEQQIQRLHRLGMDYSEIEQYITDTTNIAEAEVVRIITECRAANEAYYLVLAQAASVKYNPYAIAQELDAISQQTAGEFRNLSNSLGFAIRDDMGQLRWSPIADIYQRLADRAVLATWRGDETYHPMVRQTTRELAQSGLQWVDYETGHRNRVDVAIRRNITTALGQISGLYSQNAAAQLETNLYEITAHIGARDVCRDPMRPWQDHKSWQGRVYVYNAVSSKYPDLVRVTGYGEVDGLLGANCRHLMYPYVEGISERTWTDDQLANIDPEPVEFEGREYSAFEARQYQRQIETAIRGKKRELLGYKASGETEAYVAAAGKYQRLLQKYNEFCGAAGLIKRDDRLNIWEFGPRDHMDAVRAVKV